MLGSFADKRVAVVGMGKSNQSLCRYLVKEGAKVTCFDKKTPNELGEAYLELDSLSVSWSLGEGYLDPLSGFHYIFLTPGMKKNFPQIAAARANGALIATEIALFLDRCKAKVCGITGSAGKTTTSTLVGKMLRESLPGAEVYVGGNIGAVLIERVNEISKEALVVLELSSFQLELTRRSPEVAVVLDVHPNHLDIHSSYDEYVTAKKNIYKAQGTNDLCILNLDDPVTSAMARECPGRTSFFTLDQKAARTRAESGHDVAWLEGDELKGPAGVSLARTGAILVPGRHNVSNVLAASLATLSMGGNPEGIRKAVRSFTGVEHRIEYVREHVGVRYYNDSIATSPDRTEALLEAVTGPLVLILGGYDKGIPFDELATKIVARGDCAVVTLGKTAPLIEKAIRNAENLATGARDDAKLGNAEGTGVSRQYVGKIDVVNASSLIEAVTLAAERAVIGGSVALSPACASYDMFQNFEQRGNMFKDLVGSLK